MANAREKCETEEIITVKDEILQLIEGWHEKIEKTVEKLIHEGKLEKNMKAVVIVGIKSKLHQKIKSIISSTGYTSSPEEIKAKIYQRMQANKNKKDEKNTFSPEIDTIIQIEPSLICKEIAELTKKGIGLGSLVSAEPFTMDRYLKYFIFNPSESIVREKLKKYSQFTKLALDKAKYTPRNENETEWYKQALQTMLDHIEKQGQELEDLKSIKYVVQGEYYRVYDKKNPEAATQWADMVTSMLGGIWGVEDKSKMANFNKSIEGIYQKATDIFGEKETDGKKSSTMKRFKESCGEFGQLFGSTIGEMSDLMDEIKADKESIRETCEKCVEVMEESTQDDGKKEEKEGKEKGNEKKEEIIWTNNIFEITLDTTTEIDPARCYKEIILTLRDIAKHEMRKTKRWPPTTRHIKPPPALTTSLKSIMSDPEIAKRFRSCSPAVIIMMSPHGYRCKNEEESKYLMRVAQAILNYIDENNEDLTDSPHMIFQVKYLCDRVPSKLNSDSYRQYPTNMANTTASMMDDIGGIMNDENERREKDGKTGDKKKGDKKEGDKNDGKKKEAEENDGKKEGKKEENEGKKEENDGKKEGKKEEADDIFGIALDNTVKIDPARCYKEAIQMLLDISALIDRRDSRIKDSLPGVTHRTLSVSSSFTDYLRDALSTNSTHPEIAKRFRSCSPAVIIIISPYVYSCKNKEEIEYLTEASQAILDYVDENGEILTDNPYAINELKRLCNKALQTLSSDPQTRCLTTIANAAASMLNDAGGIMNEDGNTARFQENTIIMYKELANLLTCVNNKKGAEEDEEITIVLDMSSKFNLASLYEELVRATETGDNGYGKVMRFTNYLMTHSSAEAFGKLAQELSSKAGKRKNVQAYSSLLQVILDFTEYKAKNQKEKEYLIDVVQTVLGYISENKQKLSEDDKTVEIIIYSLESKLSNLQGKLNPHFMKGATQVCTSMLSNLYSKDEKGKMEAAALSELMTKMMGNITGIFSIIGDEGKKSKKKPVRQQYEKLGQSMGDLLEGAIDIFYPHEPSNAKESSNVVKTQTQSEPKVGQRYNDDLLDLNLELNLDLDLGSSGNIIPNTHPVSNLKLSSDSLDFSLNLSLGGDPLDLNLNLDEEE